MVKENLLKVENEVLKEELKNKKRDYQHNIVCWSVALIIVCTFILSPLLFASPLLKEVKQLGTAICEKQYNMDFDKYENKVIYCKEKPLSTETKYDGLSIVIPEKDKSLVIPETPVTPKIEIKERKCVG